MTKATPEPSRAENSAPGRPERVTISAERTRSGRIVLDRRWRLWVFLGGLGAVVALAFLLPLIL